jgi:hypothetical protein
MRAHGVRRPRSFVPAGVDPSLQRKLEKQATFVTFKLIAEELLDKMRREGRATATLVWDQRQYQFQLTR